MQLPDMVLPDEARVVHHGTDELLREEDSIPDGQPHLVFRREHSTPNLWAAFFLT
jgi:hypothetical protein